MFLTLDFLSKKIILNNFKRQSFGFFQNGKAFREISGPILAKQLGDSEFMFGDKFTALDVVIGYCLTAVRLENWLLELTMNNFEFVVDPSVVKLFVVQTFEDNAWTNILLKFQKKIPRTLDFIAV